MQQPIDVVECCLIASGFICNVVNPLFIEWNRLLASPLSLLLLDNLRANLQRWQSVGVDNVSQLTVANSSDDSTPSNADQGDRSQLNVSSEIGHSTADTTAPSSGDVHCGHWSLQTENVLRRASLPPLSPSTIARVTVRRCSSPVVGNHHVSCRRVCLLSSLAEYPTPPLIAPPSPPCLVQLNAAAQLTNGERNTVCKYVHKDGTQTTDNVESRKCSDVTHQSCEDGACDIGSNGALPNGVSRSVSNYTAIRRASAPVACPARPPAVCVARRGSAPCPGTELLAVSLWMSKLSFDAKPSRTVHCQRPSVVLVESPNVNIGVNQLDFICVVPNASSLKVPLERSVGCCREKRSHSAHAVIVNPAQFIKRRYSSPNYLNDCWNAGNRTAAPTNCTPLSISGLV